MSSVGGLTNPTKLAHTIETATGMKAVRPTVASYLSHLKDAFLLMEATRYDVKGRHYLDFPVKSQASHPRPSHSTAIV